MTALNKQALRVPERKIHNWNKAVMRDCEFCSQWSLTVKHEDGGCICASCCDAEYTSELKDALESAIDRAEAAEKRISEQSEIVAAAEKLVRCKGRYHSELNYRALAKLFGVTTPDLPPLKHENVHYADAAEMEIAALRQRIAELGGVAFNPAILDVVAERQRQKTIEGWTPEHDDEHCNGELAMAAVCYINETGTVNRNGGKPWGWPWDASWWKPKARRRNLVKAGALILAEIERIDRAAKGEK